MLWAYVIGGLVGVTAGMQVRDEVFRRRNDQANEMIRSFSDSAEVEGKMGQAPIQSGDVGRRVKKFIHNQYKQSEYDAFAATLSERFPVLDTLSPQLRCASALLMLRDYLEKIPYLSSAYLSADEQSRVALQCVTLDFGKGDDFELRAGLVGVDRGLVVLKSGCAFVWPTGVPSSTRLAGRESRLLVAGQVFGHGQVLVDGQVDAAEGLISFLNFSKVIFIPRATIVEILRKNRRAWKDCARWIHLRTLLRRWAMSLKEK